MTDQSDRSRKAPGKTHGQRSTKEIKQKLLRRAFRENRGAEMIQEIQKRKSSVKDMPEHHKAGLKFAQEQDRIARRMLEEDGHVQSRVVRAFNVSQIRDGSVEFLQENHPADPKNDDLDPRDIMPAPKGPNGEPIIH